MWQLTYLPTVRFCLKNAHLKGQPCSEGFMSSPRHPTNILLFVLLDYCCSISDAMSFELCFTQFKEYQNSRPPSCFRYSGHPSCYLWQPFSLATFSVCACFYGSADWFNATDTLLQSFWRSSDCYQRCSCCHHFVLDNKSRLG